MRAVLVACWTVKGGAGASVVAAAIAAVHGRRAPGSLLVDLGGDQPLLHGISPTDSVGVRGWTRAGASVPDDALARLEEPLDEWRALLPAGGGTWEPARAVALAAALVDDERTVVVDVGRMVEEVVGRTMVDEADRNLLVVRACPLSLRALGDLPLVPDGVLVVRDRRRAVRWQEVADRSGAPVLAELDVDPSVGASVDAGLLARPLPHRYLAALGAVA